MILDREKINLANRLTTWSSKWPTSILRIIIMAFWLTNQIKLVWLTNKKHNFFTNFYKNHHKLTTFLSHKIMWVGNILGNEMRVSHKWLYPTPSITDSSSHPYCDISNIINSGRKKLCSHQKLCSHKKINICDNKRSTSSMCLRKFT